MPMPTENRKRNVVLKKTGENEVCTSCESSRISASSLIDKTFLWEPAHEYFLKITKYKTGENKNCCIKELHIACHNLMSRIKKTEHWKKFDIKIESKKCIDVINNKIKSSHEEKGISAQETMTNASNDIRIDAKLVQLKSYSPRHVVSIFANLINHHATESNMDNVSHNSDFTPSINAN